MTYPVQPLTIDIHNDPQLLKLILDSIEYLGNNWASSVSAQKDNPNWKDCRNKTARYFQFNFDKCLFEWAAYDDSPEPPNNLTCIKDAAHISRLLESIYKFTHGIK